MFTRVKMSSVKEIKAELDQLGISYEGVFEKEELIRLLQSARSSGSSLSPTTIAMSVNDLKEIIRTFAGRPGQCSEKIELFHLAQELLGSRTCPICLERLLGSKSDIVTRLPCCNGFVHSGCVGEWALRSALQGVYPHKCPSCPSGQLEDAWVVRKIIKPSDDSGKYLRYIAAVDGILQLRANKRKLESMSNEEQQLLYDQGFRKCPKCGAWIEKGPSMEAFGITLAEGCDKMTCRCGCKFCFRCGSINANCGCTGADHGFFDHQEVLNQYPRSQLGAGDLLSNLL
jgi:hypothetical protein